MNFKKLYSKYSFKIRKAFVLLCVNVAMYVFNVKPGNKGSIEKLMQLLVNVLNSSGKISHIDIDSVDTIKVTLKGFEWKRSLTGWIDLKTDMNWFFVESMTYSFNEAIQYFNHPLKRLPSKEDYETAELHGIREIFNDFEHNVFWTSSPFGFLDFAYVLFTNHNLVPFDKSVLCKIRCLCDMREVEFNDTLGDLIK